MDHSSLCIVLYRSNMSYALAHPVGPLSDAALSIFFFGILYFAPVLGSDVEKSIIERGENPYYFLNRLGVESATASSIRRLLQVHKIR